MMLFRSLLSVIAVALIAAACAGTTEISVNDAGLEPEGDPATVAPDPDGRDVTGEDQTSVATGELGDRLNARAPIPETIVDASPANRQNQQTVGPPIDRTSGTGDEPTERVETGEASDESNNETEAEVPGSSSAPRRGPANDTALDDTVQEDIVLPESPRVQTVDPRNVVLAPNRDLDDRVVAAIQAPDYACQPGVDSECTEPDIEPPAAEAAPADDDDVADPTGTQADAVGAASNAEADPALDAECPPGAASDCVPLEGAVERDESIRADAPRQAQSEVDTDVCATRPWARGCDGPEPGPENSDGDVDSDGDGDEPAEGADEQTPEGVAVPQDVIDLLLTPPPGDEASPETAGTDTPDATAASEPGDDQDVAGPADAKNAPPE